MFLSNTNFTPCFHFYLGLDFRFYCHGITKRKINISHVHILRLFVLFIIGWIHATFFFRGDILRIYAVIGLILFFMRNLPNRQILLPLFICAVLNLQKLLMVLQM